MWINVCDMMIAEGLAVFQVCVGVFASSNPVPVSSMQPTETAELHHQITPSTPPFSESEGEGEGVGHLSQ